MKNNTEQQEQIKTFDESEFFLAEIAPKMEGIIKQCHERGIPILMFAICKQTEEGCQFANMVSVNNRNGQAVQDLFNCAKILSSPADIIKSLTLKMMADESRGLYSRCQSYGTNGSANFL